MIGIQAIASYIPDNMVDNLARCGQFGKDPDFVREKIGFVRLPRKDQTMETSDMCVAAFKALGNSTDINNIDCILVCTQNPDGFGLPHTASIVHEKLKLPKTVAAFDISLGCSGFVYSVNLLINFMTGNGMRRGLLFTADPYSKVLNPQDYTTELLFGDAATCTFLTDEPRYVLGKTLFGTDGSKNKAIKVDDNTRLISMDGKDVFNFSMRVIPDLVQNCLTLNRLTSDDVDLFLFHQASKYIIDNIVKKTGLPMAKVPFLAKEFGNTVSSTIPLMLECFIPQGPKIILLCGFGVGLSWSSSILKRI